MREVLHFLAELDDGDLRWALDLGRVLRLSSGAELLRQGEPVADLHLVLEGQLEVSRDGVLLERLGPGEVVGEMALLREQPSAATVRAREAASTLAVPQPEIRRKWLSDNGFSARIHRAMCFALAGRLERADALLAGRAGGLAAPLEAARLAPAALQGLSLAHARFDWLLDRTRGG